MASKIFGTQMQHIKPLIIASTIFALISSANPVFAENYDASTKPVQVSVINSGADPESKDTLDTTLLVAQFRSSGRRAMHKIDLTAECGLKRFTSAVSSPATDNHSQVIAFANVWAEIDGKVVPIAPGVLNDDSPGIVRLCSWLEWDRALRPNRDDIKSAAGFSWIATDVPRGNHELTIKATLSVILKSQAQATSNGSLEVGKRTVTISQLR